MNLHQLRLFNQVAKVGNLTKAAEALYISQPAVSSQLKRLEASLGVALIKPRGRGIELTDFGERFYLESQRLVQLEEALEALVAQEKNSSNQRLSLAGNSIGTEVLFPKVMANLQTDFPGTELQIVSLNSISALTALSTGEVDFVISGSPALDFPEFTSELIYQDHFVYVVSSAHPLAGVELPLANLVGETFIGRERESFAQQKLVTQFDSNQLATPKFSLIFNHSQGAIEATKEGQGIHYCSALLVKEDIAKGSLMQVKVLASMDQHPLYLSYLKNAPTSLVRQALRQEIKAVAARIEEEEA